MEQFLYTRYDNTLAVNLERHIPFLDLHVHVYNTEQSDVKVSVQSPTHDPIDQIDLE